MQIAVIGADTKIGQMIVNSAEALKIRTVSIVSSYISLKGDGKLIVKDYQDLNISDFAGCHIVVDAVSFLNITRYSTDLLPLWTELEILKNIDISLLCLGSSAFLYTDRAKKRFVFDESDVVINDEQQKNDRLCVNAYKRLNTCTNVKWSIFSPPLLLDDYSIGTGNYLLSDCVLPVSVNGSSRISVNDFVKATIDILKQGIKTHDVMSVCEI